MDGGAPRATGETSPGDEALDRRTVWRESGLKSGAIAVVQIPVTFVALFLFLVLVRAPYHSLFLLFAVAALLFIGFYVRAVYQACRWLLRRREAMPALLAILLPPLGAFGVCRSFDAIVEMLRSALRWLREFYW